MFKIFKGEKYRVDSITITMGIDFDFSFETFLSWLKSGYLGFSSDDSVTLDYGRKRKLNNIGNADFKSGFTLTDDKKKQSLAFVKGSELFPFQIHWKFDAEIPVSTEVLEKFLCDINFFSCVYYDFNDVRWQSTNSIGKYNTEKRDLNKVKVIVKDGEKLVDISEHFGRKFYEREFYFIASPRLYLGHLSNEIFQLNIEKSNFKKFDFFSFESEINDVRKIQKSILDQFDILEKFKLLTSRDYKKIKIDMNRLTGEDEISAESNI